MMYEARIHINSYLTLVETFRDYKSAYMWVGDRDHAVIHSKMGNERRLVYAKHNANRRFNVRNPRVLGVGCG